MGPGHSCMQREGAALFAAFLGKKAGQGIAFNGCQVEAHACLVDQGVQIRVGTLPFFL